MAQRSTRLALKETDRRKQKDDAIEARAAARLVREQLRKSAASIKAVFEWEYWHGAEWDSGVWESQSSVLARLLDDKEWEAVSRGVAAAREVARLTQINTGLIEKSELEAATPTLETLLHALEPAMDVLQRYITIGELTRT